MNQPNLCSLWIPVFRKITFFRVLVCFSAFTIWLYVTYFLLRSDTASLFEVRTQWSDGIFKVNSKLFPSKHQTHGNIPAIGLSNGDQYAKKGEFAFRDSGVSGQTINDFRFVNKLSYIGFVKDMKNKRMPVCERYFSPVPEWTKQDQAINLSGERFGENFAYQNCTQFRAQGFDVPVQQEEAEFPLAYSILAYKDIDRLIRMLRAIYRPSNAYCIHIDLKSNLQLSQLNQIVSCLDNVFLAPTRVSVVWGAYSVLEPEMICLRALMQQKVHWRYFINLTGQEFPLKTNRELIKIFQVMNGTNDVWVDPCNLKGYRDWRSTICKERTALGWRERWLNKRLPPPHGIQIFKGQIHVLLSREFVQFMLSDQRSLDLLDWLKANTYIPDEFYFTTINSDPSLMAPGYDQHPEVPKPSIARMKIWMNTPEAPPTCDLIIRHICQLSLRELPVLTKTRQIFANKFLERHAPNGFSCLEAWLHARVLKEIRTGDVDIDTTPYEQIFSANKMS